MDSTGTLSLLLLLLFFWPKSRFCDLLSSDIMYVYSVCVCVLYFVVVAPLSFCNQLYVCSFVCLSDLFSSLTLLLLLPSRVS